MSKELIETRFPLDLVDPDPFDNWCAVAIRERVQPEAVDVVNQVRTRLEALEAHRRSQGRDLWSLFGDTDPIKSSRSIRSKVGRDLLAAGDRLTVDELTAVILGFSDLVRCRIVCILGSDADFLARKLCDGSGTLGRYPRSGQIKDFVWDPEHRHGLRGHRARQFSMRVPLEEQVTFGFEIQLMTTLQHAWDRRNHPIYERLREGGTLSPELQVNDFACAEALHLVDQQADRNWDRFLEEVEAKGD